MDTPFALVCVADPRARHVPRMPRSDHAYRH